jgi:hypothetical protein
MKQPVEVLARWQGSVSQTTFEQRVDQLLQLLSTHDHPAVSAYLWHGRLMVLGWGIAIPLGILVARYFKITRRQNWPEHLDSKFWWRAHLCLQLLGIASMSGGVAIVLIARRGAVLLDSAHSLSGWFLVTLGWGQVAGGILRGSKGGPTPDRALVRIEQGDHYNMTRRRVAFEWTHKLAGYLSVVLSVGVITLGLAQVRAPYWMWIALGAWWALLALAAARFQLEGRCIDTYQAIWGPDPSLPGAGRRAGGWGIRKYKVGARPPMYLRNGSPGAARRGRWR